MVDRDEDELFAEDRLAEVLMSTVRYRLLVSVLGCVALLAPGMAAAGVRIGIGFGTTIGPHYHHHGYGWYGGWYGWPGPYWYDPWWYYPSPVIVAPPVVRDHVIVREHTPPAPPKDEAAELVSQQLQQKRSESLERLKIGDPRSRLQAVQTLEQFAADSKVRTTLEQALLSDRDPQVRKAVAELFGRLGDKATLPVLKQARKNDADRDVRQAAYKAIIMIEGY
jgi:hypothetical protein